MRVSKGDGATLPAEAQKVIELFPEFRIEHFNDSGANGYILLGWHEVLNHEVAIKIYFHSREDVQHEPALLATINHENVLKVLDARRLDDDCSFFMTPVANYGDLRKYITDYNLSLCLAHSLLCQLLSGLAALHSEPNRLVHRDIKPENLLVHDDKLLIADFGSVRQVSAANGKASASKHSILFRPPESFGSSPYYDYSSDTYQAGLIGYILLGGRLDNDLRTYLNPGQIKQLESFDDSVEQSKFVDSCIERKIRTATLLDWTTIPCFVPRRFVTILRRSTTKTGSKYSNTSEFLAGSRIRATLPDWMVTKEGWRLSNWKNRDYLISIGDKSLCVMKRKHGNRKFITDRAFIGNDPIKIFHQLADAVGLP